MAIAAWAFQGKKQSCLRRGEPAAIGEQRIYHCIRMWDAGTDDPGDML